MTDLSGQWAGSYVYPGSLEPVPFHAEIRDHCGQLSGIVSEPAEPWARTDSVQAMLAGHRRGSEVGFVKTYDSFEHYPDPVHYEGTVDEDECEIAGTWVIAGDWSGAFVMTRPKPVRAQVEAEESVTL